MINTCANRQKLRLKKPVTHYFDHIQWFYSNFCGKINSKISLMLFQNCNADLRGKNMIGLKRGTVSLCKHETEWEIEAKNTIDRLKNILGSAAKDIQHIGSTAVPSVKAKPIIDIAVAADNFDDILAFENELRNEGFYYRPNAQAALRGQLLFACGSYYEGTGDLQTHFIHVVTSNSMDWKNYINFRDYLNSRPEAAKSYEYLKLSLAEAAPVDAGREKYLKGKHDFIVYTLRKALVSSYLGKTVEIKIDRPLGSVHPKHSDMLYPVNYGYIPGVIGGDGEDLDVYLLGVDTPVDEYTCRVIGIIHRENDVEDKLVAAPAGKSFSEEEIAQAVRFQEKYYKTTVELYAQKRLLIIDGSNLLFQMFFGMPARIVNNQGKSIQGTLGFVGALLKIIRRIQPTHAIVLFDGEHENVRSALDSGYKANRTDYSEVPEEENPFSQLPDVYAALDFIGVKHFETVVCETDDLVSSYALTCGGDAEVIISSFDSDFFQLITDNVSVLRYRGDSTVICTPDYIKEKFGVTPMQYADFKSMTGDAADNIKGADKVGVKTAALLLGEFGTLDGVIKNADKIKKPSVRASVARNAERLRRNYKLIKLDSSAGLPFALNELEYEYNGITTTEVLKGSGIR